MAQIIGTTVKNGATYILVQERVPVFTRVEFGKRDKDGKRSGSTVRRTYRIDANPQVSQYYKKHGTLGMGI